MLADTKRKKRVVIAGGGVAGIVSAIEIAEKNTDVEIVLLEKREELLRGSSDRTPCRLGLGFHYKDFDTAAKYYRATVDLLKKYRDKGIDLRLKTESDILVKGVIDLLKLFKDSPSDTDVAQKAGLKLSEIVVNILKVSPNALITKMRALELVFPICQELPDKDIIRRLTQEPMAHLITPLAAKLKKARWDLMRFSFPQALKELLEVLGAEIDPLLHGRYYFVDNPDFDSSKLLSVHERLQRLYSDDCGVESHDLDKRITKPENALFGHPSSFYRLLKLVEVSSDQISADMVAYGLETAEAVLNWPLFREILLRDIANCPNIRVETSAEILRMRCQDDLLKGYEVVYKDKNGQEKTACCDVLENATWEAIDYFNKQVGIEPKEMTNRLKIMVEIDLPEQMLLSSGKFFGIGPHVSFTNYGNGKGFITAEKFTNYAQSSTKDSLSLPEPMQRLLYGLPNGVSEAEKETLQNTKREVAEKILREVIRYIPGLRGSEIAKKIDPMTGIEGDDAIYAGIVRTQGTVVIDDANSPHHLRREGGVEMPEMPDWSGCSNFYVNASNKLLYCHKNAEEVAAAIADWFIRRDILYGVTELEDLGDALKIDQHKAAAAALKWTELSMPDCLSGESKEEKSQEKIINSKGHAFFASAASAFFYCQQDRKVPMPSGNFKEFKGESREITKEKLVIAANQKNQVMDELHYSPTLKPLASR